MSGPFRSGADSASIAEIVQQKLVGFLNALIESDVELDHSSLLNSHAPQHAQDLARPQVYAGRNPWAKISEYEGHGWHRNYWGGLCSYDTDSRLQELRRGTRRCDCQCAPRTCGRGRA